jgi:hypothetical protein
MMWPERCSLSKGTTAFVTHSGPKQVGLDLTPGLLLGELLDRAELAVARVVHDHVRRPKCSWALRTDSSMPAVSVTGQCQQALAVRCSEVLERAGVPVR